MTFAYDELTAQTERLRKFAIKLCGNAADADDLLQETVLRALEKKSLFTEGTDLGKWTSKIMFNLFISAYRRKVKFETQYDSEELINNRAISSSQQEYVELSQVDEALATLSRDHRDILINICVRGLKYEEVANDLNVPIGTVRSRLFRARENLKLAMEHRSGSFGHGGARADSGLIAGALM